ncbi:MAG: EndoS/ChiA family endoglycosidase [Catonella sp.]|uniref:EndoS/ChiA family endoglycosidase n=1 Tax=Catonella sp. TaxID=2382125 RepID=UPI003F9EDDCB
MKQKMLRTAAAILMAAVTLTSNPVGGLFKTEKVIAAEKKVKFPKEKLNKTSVTLKKGKKIKLKVKNLSKKAKVKWVSSNKLIVTVSRGNVKAKKVGKAKITAIITEKGKKKLKLSCKVTVKNLTKKKKIVKEKVTSAVVSNQAELDKVLKNNYLEELKIKSDAETSFDIPEGNYEKVKLQVETPKADVVNSGKFASILINEIKNDTWYEKVSGNKIEIKAKEGRIVVASEAVLNEAVVAEGSERVKVEVEGKLTNLLVKAETKLDVNVKGKLDSLDLANKSEVNLTSEGIVSKVNVQAESKLNIKGKQEKIELEVKKEAKGSSITTEVPVDLKTSAKVSVTLEKGAEGSKIEALEKEAEVKLENNTKEKVEVKTPEGTKEIESSNNQPAPILGGYYGGSVPSETPNSPSVSGETPNSQNVPLRDRGPLMGAYYRTWHDVASTGDDGKPHGGLNKMSEIPAEVDLAFVFTDWTAKGSIFWTTLKDTYVPKLKKQGTRVIRTIGIRELTSERGVLYDNNHELIPTAGQSEEALSARYAEYAKIIFDEYVNKHNLDGLDIDLEQHDEPKNAAKRRAGQGEDTKCHKQSDEIEEDKFLQAIGIVKELRKIAGNDGHGVGKLLILDTTIPAEMSRIFQETATLWDYILVQKYGQHLAEKKDSEEDNYGQLNWKHFGRYGVKPEHFMYGFSFYEEDGDKNNNVWADTVSLKGTGETKENDSPLDPKNKNKLEWKWHLANKVLETRNPGTPEDSNAYRHAKWQPKEGMKGGIFSYAVDRDGVEEGIDATKEKCGRRNENDPLSISEQSDYYGKWGNNTKHFHTEYSWTKALKKIMLEDEDYKGITEAEIPDAALRNTIIKQIRKNWKGNIGRFGGELILDDPAIASLDGLNKFKRLKKLTLKNLPNIKELTKDMLPESLKPNYVNAPYEQTEEILVLENLSGLEKLDLSGFDLEHLPVKNAAAFTNLKSFDVSKNKIDFSAGEDKTALEALYALVKDKEGHTFEFGSQKPQGYMPKVYTVDKIKEPNEDEKIPVGSLFAFGVGTANGEVVAENDFEAYKAKTVLEPAKTFIDQSYTWEAFKTFENADNQIGQVSFTNEDAKDKVEILDHSSANVTATQQNGISRKAQETYFLTYSKYYQNMKHYDEKGNYTGEGAGYRKLHTCKIVVGEELEKLTNFALNAKVIGMSFTNGPEYRPTYIIKNLFNGKMAEEKNKVMLGGSWSSASYWLAFDIGKEKEISSWIVDTRYDNDGNGSIMQTIKKGELYYFEGVEKPTDEEMKDDSKWTKADEYNNPALDGVYSKTFNSPIRARYWKYQIKDQGGIICISEIQLQGKGSGN